MCMSVVSGRLATFTDVSDEEGRGCNGSLGAIAMGLQMKACSSAICEQTQKKRKKKFKKSFQENSVKTFSLAKGGNRPRMNYLHRRIDSTLSDELDYQRTLFKTPARTSRKQVYRLFLFQREVNLCIMKQTCRMLAQA